MRRAFLLILSVVLLTVAGSVVMAQTDYGSAQQPAADTSPTTSPADTSGATSDTTSQPEGTSTDPASGTAQPQDSSLPATASNLPLFLAIGLSAAGAIVVLRVYRIRYAR